MKRRMRKVTALVLSVGMMLSMTITSGAVTIDEAQKKADELQSQKSAAQAEKDTLAAKLNSIIDQMNKTQEELSAKETEISTAEEELVQAKVDEDDQYNSMKKRIKFMYEGGNTKFLEILMSSSNIGDLLNKAEYVSKLSSYDRDMLVAFQETVKAVEEKEAKLKDEYEKLNTLQTSLVSQQTEAQNLISSKEAQIAEIQNQITDNANILADLKAKAEAAKRLQEEQAAAAAAAAAKKNNSGSSSNGSSSSRPASSGNVVSGSGYFTHPCPGMTYQSSYFGEVRSFDSRPHKGLCRTDRNTYICSSSRNSHYGRLEQQCRKLGCYKPWKWIGDKVYASQLNLCECRSESSKRTTDWICWFYRIFNRSTSTFPGGA